MCGVVDSQSITAQLKNQQSRHWRLGVIELTSQALARYFRTLDERHIAIYESLKSLIEGDNDTQ